METTNRYIVMSVPGDEQRGDVTAWFVYDANAPRKSVECESFEAAKKTARELRAAQR